MRKIIFIFSLLDIIASKLSSQQVDFPKLVGAYLGQKLPGTKPKIFAPGIISTDISEGCSSWGNEMEYFIFQRWIDDKPQLYVMNQVGEVWSEPELLTFFFGRI